MSDNDEAHMSKLRQDAVSRVHSTPVEKAELSADEIKRAFYELEVHQEELRIQNEELLRTQQELVESRDLYADLYDFAPVGYVTVADDGKIEAANLSAATMLGIDRSKLIGSRFALYCNLSSRVQLNAHLQEVRSSASSRSCELTFDRGKDTTFDARLDSNVVAAASSSQVRVVISDISEQKKTQRALLQKEKYLRSLADALPALIGYLNSDFEYQFANAAHNEWFGVANSEVVGRSIQDVFGVDSASEMADYLVDALAGHQVEFEFKITHAKKGVLHVQIMFVPDTDLNRNVVGIHCLVIDITERKIVEQQNSRRRFFEAKLDRLNSREFEVYQLLVCGKSNKAIAMELDIGLRTAVRRRQNILNKLEVETLAELLLELAGTQGYDSKP